MFGRDSSVVKKAVVGVLVCVVHCATAAAQAPAPPPAVTVSPVVSRQVTETGDFIGRVMAINKVDIVARVAGFIEERNFTEGQQVKTGDLLFRIEQATYKAAVDQQQANLAKAKATEVNAALQLAARQGACPQPEHPAIHARPAGGRRGGRAGRGAAGRRHCSTGGDQSRLHRNPLADRRTDRACHFHRRQSGRALVRKACDHRQPGSDLCHLSGERARCSRLQAQGRRIGRQEPACDDSHQAAQRHASIRIPGSPIFSTSRSMPIPTPSRCGRNCRIRMVC